MQISIYIEILLLNEIIFLNLYCQFKISSGQFDPQTHGESISCGIGILLSMANFFNDSNLQRQFMLSSRILRLLSCIASISCHSCK